MCLCVYICHISLFISFDGHRKSIAPTVSLLKFLVAVQRAAALCDCVMCWMSNKKYCVLELLLLLSRGYFCLRELFTICSQSIDHLSPVQKLHRKPSASLPVDLSQCLRFNEQKPVRMCQRGVQHDTVIRNCGFKIRADEIMKQGINEWIDKFVFLNLLSVPPVCLLSSLCVCVSPSFEITSMANDLPWPQRSLIE